MPGGAAPAGVQSSVRGAQSGAGESRRPPCPDAVRLTLDRAPAPAEVTDYDARRGRPRRVGQFLFRALHKAGPGRGRVWAVRREGAPVSTAGAYALSPDTAYLAAVETWKRCAGRASAAG
ncbi:MAG: hypothetical protein ACLR7U_02740 [Ruthenibacterium lactatiformans]